MPALGYLTLARAHVGVHRKSERERETHTSAAGGMRERVENRARMRDAPVKTPPSQESNQGERRTYMCVCIGIPGPSRCSPHLLRLRRERFYVFFSPSLPSPLIGSLYTHGFPEHMCVSVCACLPYNPGRRNSYMRAPASVYKGVSPFYEHAQVYGYLLTCA